MACHVGTGTAAARVRTAPANGGPARSDEGGKRKRRSRGPRWLPCRRSGAKGTAAAEEKGGGEVGSRWRDGSGGVPAKWTRARGAPRNGDADGGGGEANASTTAAVEAAASCGGRRRTSSIPAKRGHGRRSERWRRGEEEEAHPVLPFIGAGEERGRRSWARPWRRLRRTGARRGGRRWGRGRLRARGRAQPHRDAGRLGRRRLASSAWPLMAVARGGHARKKVGRRTRAGIGFSSDGREERGGVGAR